ncbi:MAG: hypothetical protein LBD48_04455 [Treponema sp.]|jgi:hypothetical protein|nr:hypothetical protein [Treponema sp.]
MPKPPDLYPILRGYANKNNSAYIEPGLFLEFLEKYAAHKTAEQPEWDYWLEDAEAKFWNAVSSLAESGRCVLLADTPEGRIYMPFFYRHQIQEAYRDIDKLADVPFPAGESLNVVIPENQTLTVNLYTDMGSFFDAEKDGSGEDRADDGSHQKEAGAPEQIVRLLFPQDYGSALLLESMIPQKLMEIAFLKVRHYLRSRNNKDFVLNKMIPQLQGKEKYLREFIDQIIFRPLECLDDMEKSADFPYLFWTYFCPLVKNDIKKRNEFLSEDLAALQAVCIIEVCSSFYRNQAAKKREVDVAFKTLDVRMERSPWYFTLDDIIGFTNDKDVPLLQIYSKQDLEAYIQKNISETVNNELPAWIVMQGGKGERWFVKKEKYLAICSKMLIEARDPIKKVIIKRWSKMIKEFRKEPAMEKDAEFDRLLTSYTGSINPVLAAILDDPKLILVYEELDRVQGAIPPASRIFREGRLIPASSLYALRRRDMLTDVRILLPFWYSISFIVAILAFLKGFGKKKSKKTAGDDAGIDNEFVTVGQEGTELQQSALSIQSALVPPDRTLDEYLSDLEGRWSQILDRKARQNLIYDVQALVRDNLRNAMRVHKTKRITREGLSEMAAFLVRRNSALQKLGSQNALRLYMELYMVKLLLNNPVHSGRGMLVS